LLCHSRDRFCCRAIELASSIEDEGGESIGGPLQPSHSPQFQEELCSYYYALSLHRLGEFRRAAHTLTNCHSQEACFLRCYSLYLAGEKEKEDGKVDAIGPDEESKMENEELLPLKRELAEKAASKQLDSYGYYLYGVVLRELGCHSEAREAQLSSLSLQPLFWGAWSELATLCESREMLYSLSLPYHWLKDFFLAAASLRLVLVEDALSYYSNLSLVGFGTSSYITAQLALVNYHKKDYDSACGLFAELRRKDPFRLTDLDVFSHILFVMEQLQELSQLAQDVVKIDKYRAETCSVLGNFYSLRGDHDKAIAYFRRAIRLNEVDHSAWILLGHEFLEKKNCCMALEAYSRGVAVNKQDFRGYYGMGHVYEMLEMPHYALYYYKQAHRLRASDSRILLAMGLCYEELCRWEEAKMCLKRAIAFQDPEGTAIIKLAKLHEKRKEEDEACKLYTCFVAQAETAGVHVPEEQGHAHLFLAQYHLKRKKFLEAEAHAHKCTEFLDTREEGKSVMAEVQRLRSLSESQDKPPGIADLATSFDLGQEISPIT
jgi:anaphase-promoting complex subunit 8